MKEFKQEKQEFLKIVRTTETKMYKGRVNNLSGRLAIQYFYERPAYFHVIAYVYTKSSDRLVYNTFLMSNSEYIKEDYETFH